jgi:hypothetical protein
VRPAEWWCLALAVGGESRFPASAQVASPSGTKNSLQRLGETVVPSNYTDHSQRLQGLVLKTAASGPTREPFVCQRLHLLTPLSSKASTKSVISRTQARSLNLWDPVMLMLLTIRYVRGFYRGRYTWSINYLLPAMSLGVSSNSWPLSPIRRKFLAKLKNLGCRLIVNLHGTHQFEPRSSLATLTITLALGKATLGDTFFGGHGWPLLLLY